MHSHTLDNGLLRLAVLPQFGGSWASFQFKRGDQWFDLFRSAGDQPSLSNLALFPMGDNAGRIEGKAFTYRGQRYELEHPDEHALHGNLRRTALTIIQSGARSISLEGQLVATPGLRGLGTWRIRSHISLAANSVRYTLDATNVGNHPAPGSFGLHMMCLQRPAGAKDGPDIRYKMAKWYPPRMDLPVPQGRLEALPAELDRSKVGPMGPTWDHCMTEPGDNNCDMIWSDIGLTLGYRTNTNACRHLQVWRLPYKDESSVCAAEWQTAVADQFRFDPAEGFAIEPIGVGQSLWIDQSFTVTLAN